MFKVTVVADKHIMPRLHQFQASSGNFSRMVSPSYVLRIAAKALLDRATEMEENGSPEVDPERHGMHVTIDIELGSLT